MPHSLIFLIVTGTIVGATSLVADAAGAFLWASATAAPVHGAATGVMAAVYAPFALVALVLPALAAPMARVTLGFAGAGRVAVALPASPWLAGLFIFGFAELLIALVRATAGEPLLQAPAFVHGLLALYAAAAAYLSRRPPGHDRDTSSDIP